MKVNKHTQSTKQGKIIITIIIIIIITTIIIIMLLALLWRILMANRAICGLKEQLSSRYLRRQTKCTVYKTPVRPLLTYGSES
jgi:flagellar basal body-associated protein FliL